jgi:hypothetical protein
MIYPTKTEMDKENKNGFLSNNPETNGRLRSDEVIEVVMDFEYNSSLIS